MKKLLVLPLIIFAIMSVITSNVSADGSRIYDPDGCVSNELYSLENALDEATEATRVEFFVYIHSDGYAGESRMLSYFNAKDTDDVVLLEIERIGSTYYYELYTYGDAYALISDSDADYILDYDGIFFSIKGGALAEGIRCFATVTSDVISSSRKSAKMSAIIWPIVIGIAVGAITVVCVVVKYKRKLKSPSYPLSKYASLNLTYSDDSFIGSNVTRVRINTSSGGGGGRGSGGSRGRR